MDEAASEIMAMYAELSSLDMVSRCDVGGC